MSRDFKEAMSKLFALGALLIILSFAIPMLRHGASAASTDAGTHVSCTRLALCATSTPRR